MGRLHVLVVTVAATVAVAACGGPDKPMLANAPKPDPDAVAGVAAAAAAAITLASPDAHRPESKQDTEKKPIKVKEHVTSDVLDRLDNAPAGSGSDAASQKQPGDTKEPPEPIDYSELRGPPLKKK